MVVEIVDGVWVIDAPWLDEPVTGPTFEATYEVALLAFAGRNFSQAQSHSV